MASRRQYLTQSELAIYADIQITDTTEADDRISQAEEIIDAYAGVQDKFLSTEAEQSWFGKAQGGSTTQLTLEARHQNIALINFLTFCEIEIIGGTGNGQRTIILSNTYPNSIVTFRDALVTAVDNTSFYRIYQLGKFPRRQDVYLDAINPAVPTYYKRIVEEVKRATAAQVEFMIEQGDSFFRNDDIFKTVEKLGDYMYDKARDGSGTGIEQLIAPKAKMYLRSIINRKGRIIV